MASVHTGRVVAAGVDHVTIEMADGPHVLRCGARVAVEALASMGRRVRFSAELSELTQTLTSPIYVIGSEYGLKAVEA